MGYIPEEVIQQVIDRSDIVAIISEYVPLKKAGRNFKALSPFTNEKTPSFFVSPDKQIYHCFSTHEGGNVITFIMQQERMSFPEAVRFLAQKIGMEIPEDEVRRSPNDDVRQELVKLNDAAVNYFHQTLLMSKEADVKSVRDYLKARGITLDAAKKFKLGFALDQWEDLYQHLRSKGFSLDLIEKGGFVIPRDNKQGFYDRFRGRAMFPIFDSRGRAVAFGGRTMKDDKAKYMNSPETLLYTKGRHLYGFNWSKQAIGQHDQAIVVEGYMDFIAPFDSGVENIVASLGTALTIEQIRLLRRYTHNVVMLFDNDKAGQNAIERSLDSLIDEDMNVKVAALGQGEDPDSFIQKFGADAFRERIQSAQTLFDFKINKLLEEFDGQSIEGRSRICGEMLPMINRFQNEITKSGYIRQLALKLGIQENAILAELQKLKGQPTRNEQAASSKSVKQPQSVRPIERHLLQFLLFNHEWIGRAKEHFQMDDFENDMVRQVVSKLFADDRLENASQFINQFSESEIQNFLTNLLVKPENIEDNQERVFQDYVQRMKDHRSKNERQKIRQQIQQALDAGNLDQANELTEKLNQLIKG